MRFGVSCLPAGRGSPKVIPAGKIAERVIFSIFISDSVRDDKKMVLACFAFATLESKGSPEVIPFCKIAERHNSPTSFQIRAAMTKKTALLATLVSER